MKRLSIIEKERLQLRLHAQNTPERKYTHQDFCAVEPAENLRDKREPSKGRKSKNGKIYPGYQ